MNNNSVSNTNQSELHQRFMERAIVEAQTAYEKKEVPVGAVVVYDGKIIGKGHNMVETLQDATAHAEIIAITSASEYLKNWRLEKSIICVTVEPCLMCIGAIMHSRIGSLIYGIKQPELGAFTVFSVDAKNLNVIKGVKEEVILSLMQSFFRDIRRNKC